MNHAGGRRAFAVAAVAVSATVLVAVLSRPEPPGTNRAPSIATAPADPRHHRPPPKRSERHTHPREGESARGVRARARAAAKRFVIAYLRYEQRPTRDRARRLARLTAPKSPARAMLRTPLRRPRNAIRGRLVLLELHGPYRGWLKASAIVRYRDRRLLIELVLTGARGGGAYRVREVSL